jgi:transposase
MSKGKKSKPEQIVKKLQEADILLSQGKSLAVVLQHLEVAESTYYRWRSEYDGMGREQVKRLKELEQENRKLKVIVADQSLDIRMLKDVIEGKV